MDQRVTHRKYALNQRTGWEHWVQLAKGGCRFHTCTSDGYGKCKSSFPIYGHTETTSLSGWYSPYVVKVQVTVFQWKLRQFLVTPPWVQVGGNYAVTAMAQSLATYVECIGASPIL